jgi:hypothetical protein
MGAMAFPNNPSHLDPYEKWYYDSDSGEWKLTASLKDPLWHENEDGSIHYDNGNVGVGVAAPAEAVDVSGNVQATTFKGGLEHSFTVNGSSFDNSADVDLSTDSYQAGTNLSLAGTEFNLDAALTGMTSYGTGNWKIELDGNNLVFKYNNAKVLKIETTGKVISKDDVRAFGNP